MLTTLCVTEEAHPDTPRLLPEDVTGRARVRAISLFIVAEIQPLQNTGLDSYMEEQVYALLLLP